MAVFMTGATGFLGTEVASLLAQQPDARVYALVRAADEKEAVHRLKAFWSDDKTLSAAIGNAIIPLAGDFTLSDLGLSSEMRAQLAREVSIVFHLGAETGIQRSKDDLMAINRDGTRNVLQLAQLIANEGHLERFVFTSTAYVAGQRTGTILESDPLPAAFSTYYEESKAAAEELVEASELPFTICRPGMIVGNSVTGRIRNFNTIYYVLKLLLQRRMNILPVSPDQRLNMVPVDYVADAVVRLAAAPEANGLRFHLTPPEECKPTAGELAAVVHEWAGRELRIDLPKPILRAMPGMVEAGLTHNRKTEEKQKNQNSNLTALMPYFYDAHIFDRTNTDRLLGTYTLDWHDFIELLLAYACRNNFMHKTDRNVFEQVLFRLKSKSAPISYFDVAESGITETTGEQMRERIYTCAAALAAMGVRKGDKVALTGNNCTDYFALDIAIGLVGATSVPLYYTTPIEEVDLLLRKSGSSWLFVGDQRIAKQLGELQATVPLVLFSTALELLGSETLDSALADRAYTTWEQFLAAGRASGGAPRVLVDPEDLATIRYTSGTTGEPKGVMFNVGQLAWMGQVLTDLLPWDDKQHEMRYLSFLPLSHVVEGILASYAPYYMHCPAKFYYLNDFDRLTDALPQVKPSVFFSVPRFYEKVWQQTEQHPLGKRYLNMRDGWLRRRIGNILKRAVLKKAGIDQCSQLIVGSAPISEELLLKFRDLGIEVHNAYGQTEAPLITINRMGDNVVPSIGTPLPETTVHVQPDGELIVEGPQVCLGYYGLETDTIRNGVLKTGDLGSVDENGHVYLVGRKKEMIITSYGKNINCPKIEERLKNIAGVSEAVLIGENRPYCTALLWLEGESPNLADGIARMNEHLSHPETIRKWTVIDEPLSISKGELTPNLKVKRNVVQEHFCNEIEAMYA